MVFGSDLEAIDEALLEKLAREVVVELGDGKGFSVSRVRSRLFRVEMLVFSQRVRGWYGGVMFDE